MNNGKGSVKLLDLIRNQTQIFIFDFLFINMIDVVNSLKLCKNN